MKNDNKKKKKNINIRINKKNVEDHILRKILNGISDKSQDLDKETMIDKSKDCIKYK